MGFFSSLSFLTPLYVVAGLTIAVPILLHLIRRTPRGRQPFSSLMFLSPAPPRITRRSRIENWLLLLLRALAVILIVAAFCRPLWRQSAVAATAEDHQEVLVLLDTSASMLRDGLWDEAIRQTREALRSGSPGDRFSLMTFSNRLTSVLDPDEWARTDSSARAQLVDDRLRALSPGWDRTALGSALVQAAERLEQSAAGASGPEVRRLVVVSDLASGSEWESLQEFDWPSGVQVELRLVGQEAQRTNAGVQLVGTPEPGDPPFVRVRVSNATDSEAERFRLGWRDPFSSDEGSLGDPVEVYVPPGQSRVVRLPRARGVSDPVSQVVLTGDAHPFDNSMWVVWPRPRDVRILLLADPDSPDESDVRLFLRPLFPDSAARSVEFLDELPASAQPTGESAVSLVIVTAVEATAVPELAKQLRPYLQAGGCVLVVVEENSTRDLLYTLAGHQPPRADVLSAQVEDYAMFGRVDFQHPLFRQFDDPRYSDFSKVHFWHYRLLDERTLPEASVLARLDSEAPWLLEQPVGAGTLLAMTSGWTRRDSELGLWSKFVAIMNELLEYGSPPLPAGGQLVIGEPIPVSDVAGGRVVSITGPAGTIRETERIPRVTHPGLYRVQGEGNSSVYAANVPPEESQTAPLDLNTLKAFKIPLQSETQTPSLSNAEQLARTELESRQKLWRWLILAAIAVLLVESVLAARRSRVPDETPA